MAQTKLNNICSLMSMAQTILTKHNVSSLMSMAQTKKYLQPNVNGSDQI